MSSRLDSQERQTFASKSEVCHLLDRPDLSFVVLFGDFLDFCGIFPIFGDFPDLFFFCVF